MRIAGGVELRGWFWREVGEEGVGFLGRGVGVVGLLLFVCCFFRGDRCMF